MKDFKGTPGPWFEHREGSSTVYVEAKLRDGVIQEVAACGPTEAGSEAQSANARLITAAPELLYALRLMLNAECSDTHNHAVIAAENAIAKALGESNE